MPFFSGWAIQEGCDGNREISFSEHQLKHMKGSLVILSGKSYNSFLPRLLLALLCVVSGWFYGLKVSPMGLATIHREIPPFVDLFPAWFGSREVLLHHGDPYADQLTVQIQKAVYGHPAGPGMDQQHFAYPVFSAILFLPFALLPLHLAIIFAFVVFAALMAFSAAWWTGRTSLRFILLAGLFAAASFPCYYALVALQPTVLIASIMAVSYAAARRDHLIVSGMLLALTCTKPQLAIGLIIPVFAWVLCDLRGRRKLLLSFFAAGLALLALGQLLLPGWIPEWLGILRAYSGYARATSVVFNLGGLPGIVLTVAIVASVAVATWRHRDDLSFTSALWISTVLLVVPLHIYDQYLLMVPVLWLFVNRDLFTGWTGRRLLIALEISIIIGWFWQILLVPMYMLSQHAAMILWGLPFGATGVIPYTAFLPLLYRAFRITDGSPVPAQELVLSAE